MYVAGIDVSESRGLDIAVLDGDSGSLLESAWLPSELALARWLSVWAHHLDVVAVDAPGGPAHQEGGRQVEQSFQSQGVSIFLTPTAPEEADGWMQVGWRIYDLLKQQGFPEQRTAWAGTPTSIECYPYSTYVALSQDRRPPTEKDTMWAHRLIRKQGYELQRPTKDAADAVAAALTALAYRQGRAIPYGSATEGIIWTPAPVPSFKSTSTRMVVQRTGSPSTSGRAGGSCECGCGEQASRRSRFRQGHDAKLKSRLLAAARAGDANAVEQLTALGWLKFL
ncbi:DUF429 domain-containing protein [Archangium lansingense]|uniref:DUF429 domain-containing protein n=1 Tax=Archangium lansingense TaxID=2995310 RepID=UPI003B789F97